MIDNPLKKNPSKETVAKSKNPGNIGLGIPKVEISRNSIINQIIITIGDNGTIITLIKNGKLVERNFAETPISRQVLDVMKANPNVPFSIILDNSEQNFARKTFPPVGLDQAMKLAKKQIGSDDNKNINHVVNLGKVPSEKSNKKDWNFLLVSVAKPNGFEKWINVLADLPNKFLGLQIASLETAKLVQELKSKVDLSTESKLTPWDILVVSNKCTGVRISIFYNDSLVFSRVVKIPFSSLPEVIAGNIEQELLNTIEYIRRIGFQDKDMARAFLVLSENIKKAVQFELDIASELIVLTPFELSSLLDKDAIVKPNDNYSDILISYYISSLAKKSFSYKPDLFSKIQRLAFGSIGLKIAAVFAILYFLNSIVTSIFKIDELSENVAKLEKEEKSVKADYNEFLKISNKFSKEYRDIVRNYIDIKNNLDGNAQLYLNIFSKATEVNLQDNYLTKLSIKAEKEKTRARSNRRRNARTPVNDLTIPKISVKSDFDIFVPIKDFNRISEYASYLEEYANDIRSIFSDEYNVVIDDFLAELRSKTNLLNDQVTEETKPLVLKVNLEKK